MANWAIPKEPQKTGRWALIDGDVIVYRVGFACQKDIYILEYAGETYTFTGKKALNEFLYLEKLPPDSEGVAIRHDVFVEPEENAYHSVKVILDQILDATSSDGFTIFLTGRENFRNDVAKTAEYKGTRPGRKPELYQKIRDYMVRRQGAVVVEGYEADDAIAMNQTSTTTICSIDKDLKMVPGNHYDWVKDELVKISPEEGHKNFWGQMLTGDATDNIIGLHGVGPAKAKKALEGCSTFFSMYEKVWSMYKEYFIDDAADRFVENIHLLWMLENETQIPIKTGSRGS